MGSEGRNEDDERLHHLGVLALQGAQLVGGNHEGRDRGVVGELLDVLRDLLDELVERLELFGRGGREGGLGLMGGCHEVPELLEEAVATVDAGHVPGLRLLDGTQEHLVEAQRVGTILLTDVVGVHHIVLRLRHLLDGLIDNILALGIGDELSLLELRTPLTNLVDVKLLAVDGADVGIDGVGLLTVVEVTVLLGLVVVALLQEVVADKAGGALQTENEARPALNHALVDQLAERLVLAGVTRVVEELIPEARVDEVTRGML